MPERVADVICATASDAVVTRREGNDEDDSQPHAIFFLAPDNILTAATVDGAGSGFEVGAVRPLFPMHPKLSPGRFPSGPYDVSSDRRFLVNTLVGQVNTTPITLVVNWTAGLKN